MPLAGVTAHRPPARLSATTSCPCLAQHTTSPSSSPRYTFRLPHVDAPPRRAVVRPVGRAGLGVEAVEVAAASPMSTRPSDRRGRDRAPDLFRATGARWVIRRACPVYGVKCPRLTVLGVLALRCKRLSRHHACYHRVARAGQDLVRLVSTPELLSLDCFMPRTSHRPCRDACTRRRFPTLASTTAVGCALDRVASIPASRFLVDGYDRGSRGRRTLTGFVLSSRWLT